MSTRTMVESTYGGVFLCKNASEAWDKDLSNKTYEWETTREALSLGFLMSMANRGKLLNDFGA